MKLRSDSWKRLVIASAALWGTASLTAGTIRPDATAEDVAVAVLAQLRGIGLQRLVDSPAVDTERLRRSVTGYWHRALALPQP